MSGRAGQRAVCDLPARTQQPSDIPLCYPLPDEESQLRGPARGAGGAAALAHALRSLRPGHRCPQWKTGRSRSVALITGTKRTKPHRPKCFSAQSLCNFETLWWVFFFSSGGYNREECLRTVECYDPKEDRWTFIAPMRTPRARFQMAVLMVKEMLFLIHIEKYLLLTQIEKNDYKEIQTYKHLYLTTCAGSAVCDRGLQRTFRRAELWRAVRPAGRRMDPGAGTEDKPLQRR